MVNLYTVACRLFWFVSYFAACLCRVLIELELLFTAYFQNPPKKKMLKYFNTCCLCFVCFATRQISYIKCMFWLLVVNFFWSIVSVVKLRFFRLNFNHVNVKCDTFLEVCVVDNNQVLS